MPVAIPKMSRETLRIAGSNKFGRYPKISTEATYNMYVSDGWLIPSPGHERVLSINPEGEGRGIFASTRGKFMVVVIGNEVWTVDEFIKTVVIPGNPGSSIEVRNKVGNIETFTGDVFIDENDAQQIAICDKKDLYIYNYRDETFQKITLDFTPGYIAFQDTYFIAPILNPGPGVLPGWRLSAENDGTSWPNGANNVGSFQTKPDNVVACVRVPGKGNQLFVMGTTVTEVWNDVGYKLFPYYRTNSFNIDYGCINSDTIATSDRFVIWLAINEKSGPVIMYSDGGPPRQISTDGINFELAQLTKPNDAYGFLFKNDGHLFYYLTFNTDNVTYLYDFNTNQFFYLTNENMGNHIAKKVTFFANDYYFISLVDGDIYRLSSDLTTANGKLVPRVRVCNTLRIQDASSFIVREMGFTIQQGDSANISRIDVSISKDDGVTFGNVVGRQLNPLGKRKNRLRFQDLGRANSFTPQFRFWGDSRFICTDGYVEAYK